MSVSPAPMIDAGSVPRDRPHSRSGMRRGRGTLLLLVAAFVLATVVGPWWDVAVVAFLWGVWTARRPRPVGEPTGAVTAGVAAALAWGALLLWTATRGPLGALVTALGHVVGIPGALLVLLALALAALLAGSAAQVGTAVAAALGGALGARVGVAARSSPRPPDR